MYFLFDIGGSKIRMTVSRDGKSLGDITTIPTPQDFGEAMNVVKTAAANYRKEGISFRASAGGIAGVFDDAHSVLLRSPNLPDWTNKPLRQTLEDIVNAPVFLENDAIMEGLGEVEMGAGKGYPIVAYITVGTGIGGARFVDGKIDKYASGFEPGHQLICCIGEEKAIMCPSCKVAGHFEGYVSGIAFQKRYGKLASEITDQKILDEAAQSFACGIHNVIVHWSPHIIVLGGFLITHSIIPLDKVRLHLSRTIVPIFPSMPPLSKALLGEASGLWGALSYARHMRQ